MIFDVQSFLNSLPIMGMGMLGIFAVISVMVLCVVALKKIFPSDRDK